MIAALVLASALSNQGGWPVSERVFAEALRLQGKNDFQLAYTMSEAGQFDLFLRALDAQEPKAPARRLAKYKADRDSKKILDLVSRYHGYFKREFPEPIETLLLKRDRSSLNRALSYFVRMRDAGSPFIATEYVITRSMYSENPAGAFCGLLYDEGLVLESLEAAEALLKGREFESFLETFSAFSGDKYGNQALEVVRRHRAGLSSQFLARLYQHLPVPATFQLAVENIRAASLFVSDDPVRSGWDSMQVRELYYKLSKQGMGEDATKLLADFWPQIRSSITVSTLDPLMWIDLYKKMGDEAVVLEWPDMLIEKAKTVVSNGESGAQALETARWVCMVLKDRDATDKVMSAAAELAPVVAAQMHFDRAKDLIKVQGAEAAFDYVEKHIDLMIFRIVAMAVYEAHEAGNDEKARTIANIGYQRLIRKGRPEIDLEAFRLLNAIGLEDLAKDLVQRSFKGQLTPETARMAALLHGAIGEDVAALECFRMATREGSEAVFAIMNWASVTKRPPGDLLSLGGANVFSIVRGSLSEANEGQATMALNVFTSIFKEYPEGDIAQTLLDCMATCLQRTSAESRQYYEADTLLRAIDGEHPLSVQAQELVLDTVVRARR